MRCTPAAIACGGHHGLPEADAAVVAGNAGVREDSEATLLEAPRDALEQERILEHAAGERHGAEPRAIAERRADLRHRSREPVVEPRRHDGRSDARAEVLDDGTNEVAAAHPDLLLAAPGDPIGVALRRVGSLLELDRRLALVADLVAHAGDGCDGVEEPAGARGRW